MPLYRDRRSMTAVGLAPIRYILNLSLRKWKEKNPCSRLLPIVDKEGAFWHIAIIFLCPARATNPIGIYSIG